MSNLGYPHRAGPSPARKRLPNPVLVAVEAWLSNIQTTSTGENRIKWKNSLIQGAPKRYVIYEPMVLLPPGSFAGLLWITLLAEQDEVKKSDLWNRILQEINQSGSAGKGVFLTHLAINEGIPLQREGFAAENTLRSPSGLKVLHGDFGNSFPPDHVPSAQDFQDAFWVSTRQNKICQTWAPLWTMFSRGNVKEKARIKEFKAAHPSRSQWAVDLYAGIGYFTYSYASLGFRVLCWEINPWSVEGLRRGAQMNGWSVRVVQGEELGSTMSDIMAGGDDHQIVVFLEDNTKAPGRMHQLKDAARDVAHVNCGFLPSSLPTWRASWDMTRRSPEAWLHLHENVHERDVGSRKQEIEQLFASWAAEEDGGVRSARVSHVEYVKTFAPSVWHVVFDMYISSRHSLW